MDKTFIGTLRLHLFTLVTNGHITGLTGFKEKKSNGFTALKTLCPSIKSTF